MMIDKILLENDIFKFIKPEHLKTIAPLFVRFSFKKKFTFFNEGDNADSMFIIESGRVSIQSQNIHIFERGKNDCIGEMALFDNSPRSATVIALTSGRALKLAASNFNILLTHHPEICAGFAAVLLKKIRADFIIEKKNLIEREKQRELMFQKEKLSAMGEMIGAIAHQWRQPLNSLSILVQEIQYLNHKHKLDSGTIDKIVNNSLKQIQFMSDTVDDFRNYFRQDKEKQDFNLVSAVTDAAKLMYQQLKAHNIFIKINDELITANNLYFNNEKSDIFSVFSFQNEFKQVILNLITNARDSILEKRKKNNYLKGIIEFHFDKIKNKIMITVKDNGAGVSKKIAKRIFEPYFSTKQNAEGAGIGLYLSKMIIENNMRGTLKLSSAKPSAAFVIEIENECRNPL